MKDSEIKKLFAGLKIEEPSANFEDKIIANAFAKPAPAKKFVFMRYAAVAATVLFVASFVVMNPSKVVPTQEYSKLVDDSAIVSEDDIYDDLISG